MIYALIAAGGKGTRFSGEKPKQFFPLGEKTVLETTVLKFEQVSRIEKIIVACPKEWVTYAEKLLSGMRKVCVIAGGQTRNETVINGINFIEKNFSLTEDTLVVTHDAARPFVTHKVITENIEKAAECGAAVAAIKAVDTVIESRDGEYIRSVPERKYMYRVQTPQTFSAQKLRELFLSLSEKEKASLTDCSGIFILRGEKVAITEGDEKNIKITFKADLENACQNG